MNHDYDLIVIGGGSGGVAAAQRAARYGIKVALIEQGYLGGTCVNVGCVPKKIMWHAANLSKTLSSADEYGFSVPEYGFDWQQLCQSRDAYLRRLNMIYQERLENAGIALIQGTAQFRDAQSVRVDDRPLIASYFIIATGSKPTAPPAPFAGFGINSNGFFARKTQPRRAVIVGGGYIAVELVGVLHALGVEVHLVVRTGQLLRGFDAMLGESLLMAMKAEGIHVLTNSSIHAITPRLNPIDGSSEGDLLRIQLSDNTTIDDVDTLLWAIGRNPLTEDLGLAQAGVALSAKQAIIVDCYQQTNVPHIYAIGDVIDKVSLTPVAIAAGRCLSDRLFGDQADRYLDYDNVPSVVFSHPPIASVGLSEASARVQYGTQVKVYETRFKPMIDAFKDSPQTTVMKLITLLPKERVIGCHVIGHGADEMMQGFAVALKMGATKQDFDDTVAIHPTSAEELVTM